MTTRESAVEPTQRTNSRWTKRKIIWRAALVVWVAAAISTSGIVSSILWLAFGGYILASSIRFARRSDGLRRIAYRAGAVVGVAVVGISAYQTVFGGHSAAWQHGYDYGYEVNQADLQVYGNSGALTSKSAQQLCSGFVGQTNTPFVGKYGTQAPPAANSPGVSDWVAGCVAAEVSGAGAS